MLAERFHHVLIFLFYYKTPIKKLVSKKVEIKQAK